MKPGRAHFQTFSSPDWMAACAVAKGGVVRQFGSHLLLQRRIGPWKIAGLPLPKCATPISGGLVGRPEENNLALQELDSLFAGSDLSFLQVTSATPPPANLRASRVVAVQNLEIDLTPACTSLWNGISSLPRRTIKKAVRNGVRIHALVPSREHLAAHWDISDRIFESTNQAPVHTRTQQQAMISLPLRSNLRMFSASQNGITVGHLLSVRDGNSACYWDVAVNELGRSTGAGHLLFWTWMRWCKRNGIHKLDLMGSPEGGRAGSRSGIGRFKISFGAQPRDYWVIYWMRHGTSLALDLSQKLSRLRYSCE